MALLFTRISRVFFTIAFELFLFKKSNVLLVFLQQNNKAFDVCRTKLPRTPVAVFIASIAFELFFMPWAKPLLYVLSKNNIALLLTRMSLVF